jgi:poly(hydroxyalkanoate) depolymerase family esterase
MNIPLAPAIRRALEETRSGNLLKATRSIQAALGGAASEQTEFLEASPDPSAPSTPKRARRPLGETISGLVNLKSLAGMGQKVATARQARSPQVPGGARYEARHHKSAFGSRDYKLFVPSERVEPVQGLIVMLHGCTQSADDFAAGTRMNVHAERHNLIVVYPEQDGSANQMSCWNWFQTGHQNRDSGEPAMLADLAADVTAEFAVKDGRTFVAGLSAGGAMAAIVGQTHPEVFAAVGVHSGLARGAARDMASAFGAMRGSGGRPAFASAAPVPTIVFHGKADTTVHPANADHVLAAALTGAAGVEIIEPDGALPLGVSRRIYTSVEGATRAEAWLLDGVGHAWSGGSPDGSYTHADGPDASAEMVRFFLSVATENAE